jgi:hypothetical protein
MAEEIERAPALGRLEDQLGWYERSAARSQRSYRLLKLIQLVLAAAIPVAAAAGADSILLGVLGGIVVVGEGVQQLFHFQENWISYRTTAEALKQEKFLYAAQAGPYRQPDGAPGVVLAERVETLLAGERAGWAGTVREQPR